MSLAAPRIAVLLALVALPATVAAAPLRVGRPAGELRLVFLEGDATASLHRGASSDATLDVGQVTAAKCVHGCARTIVQRSFRIRVDGATTRFARVVASLENDEPGRRVRLDGRLLTSASLIIDALSPVGIAIAHTIEIEVPASDPAGSFAQAITWRVEDVR